VSFLIADLSGRALVRLAHVSETDSPLSGSNTGVERRDDEESAEVLPFDALCVRLV
jgi:hypothetical protein